VAITTVGVDVSYNEQALSALALESNGRHYFVENDAALPRVFEGEAQAATSALASGAEAAVTLAPGVELERVFDRSFTRAGRRIAVPLGAFTRGETKTVLVQVRAPAGGAAPGEAVALADVEVTYHDQTTRSAGACRGALAARAARDAAGSGPADPVVVGRVERSETASSINRANELFASGRAADATKLLEGRAARLKGEKARVASGPVAGVGGQAAASAAVRADADFERQARAVDEAQRDFASAQAAPAAAPTATVAAGAAAPRARPSTAAPPPPAETREGKAAVKRNVERASPFAL
jgi:Ca-activated chloride channel family protein